MLATGLSASTQSGVGIAAATVSPMISYEIGQKFKELAKDNPDGKLTEKQQAAHVLAHAVLGAAVAAAGGNDALAGALSAGGAEAVAPKVSTFLYGTADPEKLTAEQKDTVANIMSLAGASVGAAVGNTSANAVSGSLNAESAVENNYYLAETIYNKTDINEIIQRFKISKDTVKRACILEYDVNRCNGEMDKIIRFATDKNAPNLLKPLKTQAITFLSEHPDLLKQYLKSEYYRLESEDKSILSRYIQPGAQIVSGGVSIALSTIAGSATCAETFGFGCAAAIVSGVSGVDHLTTGVRNFGKPASEQNPTITVQALMKAGLSEEAANYLQLAIDVTSGTGSAISASKIKAVNTSKTVIQYNQNSIFYKYPTETTLVFNTIDEQAEFLSKAVNGLPKEQAKIILDISKRKNTSVIFGGSRVRGNFSNVSDVDIGFGSLNSNQADKTIKQITKQSSGITNALQLEETRIVPGNKTRTISEIKTPEEFFQRSGIRSGSDSKAGQIYQPSGSITVTVEGKIIIILPKN